MACKSKKGVSSMFQVYNKRIKAWQKHKKNGKIADVKEKNPKMPFKGVRKKN